MFSNISQLLLFIVMIMVFPDIKKAIHYKYVFEPYADDRIDERESNHIIPKQEKRYIIHRLLNLIDLPTKPHDFTNESWSMKTLTSPYIYDIFKNTIDKSEDESYNFTIRNLKTVEESDIVMTYAALLYHNDKSDIWFDVSITPKIDYVIYAELYLYPNTSDKSFKILVYSLVLTEKNSKQLRFIDSVEVTTHYKGWIKLNMTMILQYWLNHPTDNHGLYLSIDQKSENIDVGEGTIDEGSPTYKTDKHPFLVGYFASPEVSNEHITGRIRWKRSEPYSSLNYLQNTYDFVDSSRRRLNSGSCRLEKLYVRFRDLEFDNFIVAPEGYEAQYCSGECRFPLNAHMNATNHAIVQTLVHFLAPGRAPQACCAPREMGHLTVLYSRDGFNHILKKYRNMIIKSCGCH